MGFIVQAFGQFQAGRAAEAEAKSLRNIAEFNAAVQEREAEAARQKGRFEQKRQAERGARVKSALTAKIAREGGIASPVAADVAVEQAAELELENLLIGYEAETEAKRAESQAELDRLQGEIVREKGRQLRRAKTIQAGTTLLTGFGTAFAGG